jgi:hypothetical protein
MEPLSDAAKAKIPMRLGFTMAELMVVAFLLIVVFAMVAQLLFPSLMLFRVQNARSEVQQSAIVSVHWINHALQNTLIESITVGSNPTSISFLEVNEADPYDTTLGRPKTLPRFVILWHDQDEKKIKAREWPPGPPPPPTSPSPDDYPFATSFVPLCLKPEDLRVISLATTHGYRVIAKNVESFIIADNVNDPASGSLYPPLRFSIVCASFSRARGGREAQEERFSMTTQVYPRTTRW